jgi:hypothetical protein
MLLFDLNILFIMKYNDLRQKLCTISPSPQKKFAELREASIVAEKNVTKNILEGRTDRGKTVYTLPLRGPGV